MGDAKTETEESLEKSIPHEDIFLEESSYPEYYESDKIKQSSLILNHKVELFLSMILLT